MKTRVSTKGQIELPGPIRRRLDIRAGDPFDAEIEAGSIILTPLKRRPHKGNHSCRS
jgi:AbrB family looped-hinge helix DNA binding protein